MFSLSICRVHMYVYDWSNILLSLLHFHYLSLPWQSRAEQRKLKKLFFFPIIELNTNNNTFGKMPQKKNIM